MVTQLFQQIKNAISKSQYHANISRVYRLKRGFFVGKIVITAAKKGGV